MERLFVDTSAWLAHVARREPGHDRVRTCLARFGGRLVTTDDVVDEVVTLAARRLGHATAVRVGTVLRDPDVVDLVHIDPATRDDAWALFCARPDQAYSLTDCTSFAVMRRLGLQTAAALDEDFAREGFTVVP